MSELKVNLKNVGQDIVDQLKTIVPVRTGRLKKGITYNIEEVSDGYVISLTMEDYFAYLKKRTKPATLPSRKELAMARPPLPKMNSLGKVKSSSLSSRAKGLLDRIDFNSALNKIDTSTLEEQIKEIIEIDD